MTTPPRPAIDATRAAARALLAALLRDARPAEPGDHQPGAAAAIDMHAAATDPAGWLRDMGPEQAAWALEQAAGAVEEAGDREAEYARALADAAIRALGL